MSERDNDFEFDFFEEPETREAQASERPPRVGASRRPPGGGGGGPARPAQMTPLLRLVGLIALAIVLIVLLVFAISSCSGSSKRSSFQSYFEKIGALGTSSEQLGKQFRTLLTTPGLKTTDLETKIRGLAQQQLQQAVAAQAIKPPGTLRLEQQHAVDALQLRVKGLQKLADAIRLTATTKDTQTASKLLADQAARLTASDVVWDEFFRTPADDEAKQEGLTGLAAPDSGFAVSPELASARSWVPVLQRLQGAATGGADGLLHGTGLISVVAQPGGQRLSPTPTENTVKATVDLSFEVTVEDTGDAQEVQVPVAITLQLPGKPLTKKLFVDVIDPSQQAKVVFKNIAIPASAFATRTILHVEVTPVPGEKNTANNSADYPIVFSLGG